MDINPDLIAAISSAVVAVIGALAAFLKRKRISQFFTDRKRIKLEKKKSKLEARQAKWAEKNYRKFLKLKNVKPELALEALKSTNSTLVEISRTIENFEGIPKNDRNDTDDDDEDNSSNRRKK